MSFIYFTPSDSTIIENNTISPWKNQTYDTLYSIVYPLYGISHYKVDDLKLIATNLNIPISKIKKQIYNDIIELIEY